MSSAAPTNTAVGTAKQTKGAPAPAQAADSPGEMPQDLRDAGWALKEHVGADNDKFQCVNASLGMSTKPFHLPQDAIKAARAAQAKYDAKHLPEQIALAGTGKGYAVARSFSQPLKVRLTSDGLQEKCAEYDAKCAEKEAMEAEFKKVHDQYKEDLKVKEAEVQQLSAVVRKQSVEVETPCEERFYYAAKVVRIVRLDTEETVTERAMSEAETQQKLPSI